MAVDQLTKLWAQHELSPGRPINVVGEWFQLSLYFNPGAAFGMGSSFTLGFSIFAILALIGCLIFAVPRISRPFHSLALGLLLAGIAGNLWDRLFQPPGPLLGHVRDFFALRHFAVFNVADICITVAAGLIVISSLFHPHDETEAAEEDVVEDSEKDDEPEVQNETDADSEAADEADGLDPDETADADAESSA